MSHFFDRFQQVVEYLLAAAFIISGIGLIGADPLRNGGMMIAIFGGSIALYVYMVWFFFLGVGLIYAKRAKKKRVHKFMLMAIYLTTIYTITLSVAVLGFNWTDIVDDAIIGGLAAWFWLRWKLKTEYLDLPRLHSEVSTLKEDPPPLP